MMNIPFSPPDIQEDDIREVVDTLHSGWITTGPKTKLFEKQLSAYCHTDCTVCLNSATAALEMTLRALGVGPGDEVITCAYTYTASASVIVHVGASPVLVDAQPDNVQMDYDKLEAAITERTKAVIPVDLAGVLCDYDRIYEIIERKRALFHPNNDLQAAYGRIIVLADASHALGARKNGKMCGEFADFTAFSFHAVKNLTTGEGGAVTFKKHPGVDIDALYHQFQLLSLHGQSKDALAKTKIGAWEYDIVAPFFKCNMTDIMASLGISQLRRYDRMMARRHEIIARYDAALPALSATALRHSGPDFRSSGHLYLMRLEGADVQKRNAFITAMAEKGVATNVHYKPLPMHTAYKALGFDIQDFPNAYHLYENEVTLPLHTCLTDEQVDYILESAEKSRAEI